MIQMPAQKKAMGQAMKKRMRSQMIEKRIFFAMVAVGCPLPL